MAAELHHLHYAIAAVAPILGISGDVRKPLEVKVHYLDNATAAQKLAAATVMKNFDPECKHEPDPEVFLDEIAQNESFSDYQYMAIHRCLAVSDLAKRKVMYSKILTLDDNQKKQIAALCKEHCVTL